MSNVFGISQEIEDEVYKGMPSGKILPFKDIVVLYMYCMSHEDVATDLYPVIQDAYLAVRKRVERNWDTARMVMRL
jgi:hypothetical protein